jgi:Tol biopolymer transport system component
VFLGNDPRLQRPVALKCLNRHSPSRDRLARVLEEARAAARVNHPNVAAIYDVEEYDGRAFIVMEFVEGESLAARLRRGMFPPADVQALGRQLAAALASAHGKGVVHRDLKPANIHLTPAGSVKVLDFGVATASSEAVTATPERRVVGDENGGVIQPGTPAYMSPEQLQGANVDHRSDIYSLGVVLFEMATGERPGRAPGTGRDVLVSALASAPHLISVITRALEIDPDRRFQTAAELETALTDAPSRERIPDDEPSGVAFVIAQRRRWTLVLGVGVATIAIATLALRFKTATDSVTDLDLMELTTSGIAGRPAISSDGKYVTYVQQDGGASSLWMRQIATQQGIQIVPAEAGVDLYGGTISPDGSFVDFIRRPQDRFDLWRVPLLGGSPRLFAANVHSAIGWSPDGHHFAFVRGKAPEGTTSIVVADADGSHERVLAHRQLPMQFVSLMLADRPSIRPAWSPNGRVVAVPGVGTHGSPLAADVDFIDVATGSEHVVSIPSNRVRGLTWIDESAVLLNAPPHEQITAHLQMLRLAFPSGKISKVTNDTQDYIGVSMTADRTNFVSARAQGRIEIWIGDGNGLRFEEAARESGLGTINWAADRLLYDTTVSGRPSISTVGSGFSRELIGDAIEPSATSDGGTIVFNRTEPATAGLWKAQGDGRRPIQLVPGAIFAPIVTRDDTSVIFLAAHDGVQSPWIVPIEGGVPKQVVKLLAAGVDVSPDGRSIVIISRDEQRHRTVWITCVLPNCEERRTFSAPTRVGRVRWAPDGRSLAFVDPDTRRNIWLMPLDGGTSRPLTRFDDRAVVTDFSWSHDGRQLAIARGIFMSDIVLFRGLRRGSS